MCVYVNSCCIDVEQFFFLLISAFCALRTISPTHSYLIHSAVICKCISMHWNISFNLYVICCTKYSFVHSIENHSCGFFLRNIESLSATANAFYFFLICKGVLCVLFKSIVRICIMFILSTIHIRFISIATEKERKFVLHIKPNLCVGCFILFDAILLIHRMLDE